MKWSYDNTCRLQRKAAFQVHCMKRRRINATERDHYAVEELPILIIWLHPTLEISTVNWLIFLSENPQCTEFLKELTGQNTLKSPNNMQKLPKQMIKHKKPNNLLYFNYLMIHHWVRAKQFSIIICIIMVTQCTMLTLCISSNIFMTYRNILAFLLLKTQCQWPTCDRNPAPPCFPQFIIVPCRGTSGHNPDQSWLRLTAEKHKEASYISESQRKQKWGLNPEFFHPHPSRKRLECRIPLSHL